MDKRIYWSAAFSIIIIAIESSTYMAVTIFAHVQNLTMDKRIYWSAAFSIIIIAIESST